MKFFPSIALLFCVLSSYAQTASQDFFLVPYKEKNKWGLADTSGIIKVFPEYDDIIDMDVYPSSKKAFYYFKQNNKIVLVDHTNKRYFAECDSIDINKKMLFKNGKCGLYCVAEINNRHDYTVLIKPVYDEIIVYNNYVIVTSKGKKGLIKLGYDDKVTELFKTEYEQIAFNKGSWTAFKKTNGKLVLDKKSFQIPYEAEPVASVAPINKQMQEENAKNRIINNITRDASKEDLLEITPITITPIKQYIKYRENGKMGITEFVYKLDGPKKTLIKNIIIPAEYEEIEEMDMFRYKVKKNGKYGIKSTINKNDLEIAYDEIFFILGHTDAILLRKGKKYAVYSKKGTITDFEYDGYEIRNSIYNKKYLLLTKGHKKSIQLLGSTLYAPAYDAISIDTATIDFKIVGNRQAAEIIKVKNGKGMGVVTVSDGAVEVLVPVEYEDVTFCENFYSPVTIKNNLKGIDDLYRGIKILPKYKNIRLFKFVAFPEFKYPFFEVITENGEKILVNKNGKEYYQN